MSNTVLNENVATFTVYPYTNCSSLA